MIPLYTCAVCGFLSTLSSEYEVVEGVRLDKDCAEKYRRGIEPVATWVAQAIKEPTP